MRHVGTRRATTRHASLRHHTSTRRCASHHVATLRTTTRRAAQRHAATRHVSAMRHVGAMRQDTLALAGLTLVDSGWLWLALRLARVGSGWLWLALAGWLCWLWRAGSGGLALAGWLWLALAGSGCLEKQAPNTPQTPLVSAVLNTPCAGVDRPLFGGRSGVDRPPIRATLDPPPSENHPPKQGSIDPRSGGV